MLRNIFRSQKYNLLILKLYLIDDELKEIYKYAMYKKVNILLIETGEKEPV